MGGSLQQWPYRVDLSERSCGRTADRDLHCISDLSAERSVIDARLDERRRYYLQRNGEWLLAIRHVRIYCCLADCRDHLRHHLHRCWRISKSVSHGGGDSDRDLHCISDLSAERSVIDARLDERRRYYL